MMNKGKLPVLLAVIGSLPAVLLGYGLGRAGHPGEAQTTPEQRKEPGTVNRGSPQPAATPGFLAEAGVSNNIPPEQQWDVEQVAEFFKNLRNYYWRSAPGKRPPLLELASHINIRDIPGVLKNLRGHLTTEEYQGAESLLFCIYARAAPEAAWNLVLERSGESETGFYPAYYVIEEWLAKDPVAAFRAVARVEDDKTRQKYFSRALYGLADRDPELAWAELQRDGRIDPQERNLLAARVLGKLARQDVDKALRLAHSLENQQDRLRALNSITGNMAEESLEEAIALINSSPLDRAAQQEMQERLVQHLSHEDLQKARDLYHEWELGRQHTYLGGQIAKRLAQADPDEAWEWIGTLPLQAYEDAVYAFAGANDEMDLETILAKLETIPEKELRESSIERALTSVLRENPRETMAMIREKFDPEVVDEVAWVYYSDLGHVEGPRLGRELMQEAHQSGEFPDGAAQHLISSWSGVDPEGSINWALQAPEEHRKNLVRNALRNWAEADLQSAGEWVNTLPDGELRDDAISHFSDMVQRVDFLAALEWASSISDEKLRHNTLRNCARQWQRTYPEQATAWIETSDLPEKIKKRLLPE